MTVCRVDSFFSRQTLTSSPSFPARDVAACLTRDLSLTRLLRDWREPYCGCMKCLNAKTPQPMNPFFHNWALPFLSDLIGHPPLPYTFHVAMVTTSHFFFWIFFGWLDLCGFCFPPRNYLPVSLQRLAGVAVSGDISCNNPCSFTATACRPVTVVDFQHPGWVIILLECFVCFALACHSLQVVVHNITKPNAGHCKETWGIKKCFFAFLFLFVFYNNFKLTTVLRGKHISKCDILVKAKRRTQWDGALSNLRLSLSIACHGLICSFDAE